MTDEELADLIATLRRSRTDVAGVEAKRARDGVPSTLVETLSAFANTPGGGVVALGLDEGAGFAATGVADPATMQRKVQGLCADSMEPPLRPLIGLHEVEGVVVVVVEVPELAPDRKPCFYRGAGPQHGSFYRVGDGDHRMTPYEVAQMIAARGQPVDDATAIAEARAADLDSDAVDRLLARARSAKTTFRADDDRAVLRRLRALASTVEEADLVPTLAGLMCLARHPQDFLPQLTVTFVHYPRPDAAPDLRFLDSRTLAGPIPTMVADALVTVRANMTRRATMAGPGRVDTWEYPEQALREALVNALVHRDYSPHARGAQVQVEMYPDRLLIRSPGGLFGPVTPDSLGEPGVSSSRNATLMQLLEDTVIPGEPGPLCENRGSGIPAMVRALRGAGLPPPEFADRLSCFEVTFFNHTLLDDAALRWLAAMGQDNLSPSQAEALVAMRAGTTFTNSSYRGRFLLDSRVATAELGDLVARGLATTSGSRRWTTYEPAQRLTATGPGPQSTLGLAGPRQVLRALASGELTRAQIAEALDEKDRTVLAWLDRLRRTHPPLIERVGAARSPDVRYRITPAGRDGLADAGTEPPPAR